MEQKDTGAGRSYTERLARYIIIAASVGAIAALCWYFREVLAYILIAAVLSLVASPLAHLMRRAHIRRFRIPLWLCSILAIAAVLLVVLGLFSFIIPIITSVVMDLDISNLKFSGGSFELPLMELNKRLIDLVPSLGEDFRIEALILGELHSVFNATMFSNIFGSVTSAVIDTVIGIFSVVFISFFFVYDEKLFTKIILSLVKDRYTDKTRAALTEVRGLLSRYFIGIFIEVIGVALINTAGLYFIAGLSFAMSAGIGFITGMLNIIPYVGPFTGGVIGTFLGIIVKFYSMHPMGIDVSFWGFVAILAGIFVFTQMIDVFIYQPVIYSNSVKAYALEIFVVLLLAGYLGGITGMLIAIPAYTVVRVFASRFLSDVKFIRELTQ